MDLYKIKNELIKQKESKFKGNIYHYSQVNFSYNSNKLEGSRLTIDQVKSIFDTSSFISKSNYLIKLDDLTESKNHFKLFDYILDNVDEFLTKEMIIEMNKILKRNTSDEDNPRYNVGGFKIVPNIIGVFNVINTIDRVTYSSVATYSFPLISSPSRYDIIKSSSNSATASINSV